MQLGGNPNQTFIFDFFVKDEGFTINSNEILANDKRDRAFANEDDDVFKRNDQ